ncbi:MAG: NUDIX domain-containing protein [Pseudomonadota bacterium]
MSVQSYGILLYRYVDGQLQVLLVHPGGPLWQDKDMGAWSIPKGIGAVDEAPLAAARREFEEETGYAVDGAFIALGALRMKSGKIVHAWALEGDLDVAGIRSNTFTLEWPRHSGRFGEYPEIDAGRWFTLVAARQWMSVSQTGFLDRLQAALEDVEA